MRSGERWPCRARRFPVPRRSRMVHECPRQSGRSRPSSSPRRAMPRKKNRERAPPAGGTKSGPGRVGRSAEESARCQTRNENNWFCPPRTTSPEAGRKSISLTRGREEPAGPLSPCPRGPPVTPSSSRARVICGGPGTPLASTTSGRAGNRLRFIGGSRGHRKETPIQPTVASKDGSPALEIA